MARRKLGINRHPAAPPSPIHRSSKPPGENILCGYRILGRSYAGPRFCYSPFPTPSRILATTITSQQHSSRRRFISIPGPGGGRSRYARTLLAVIPCHLTWPTLSPGQQFAPESPNLQPLSSHSYPAPVLIPIPITDPLLRRSARMTRITDPLLQSLNTTGTPSSPAAQENVVGPSGGEREELVKRSTGIAMQVPTDEAAPQSPLPVTFVAIAPLLQHWLRRGRREGRQRRRREGGQRRRRQEVAPQQQTSASHLLRPQAGPPGMKPTTHQERAGTGLGGRGWERRGAPWREDQFSGYWSVCVGGGVTVKEEKALTSRLRGARPLHSSNSWKSRRAPAVDTRALGTPRQTRRSALLATRRPTRCAGRRGKKRHQHTLLPLLWVPAYLPACRPEVVRPVRTRCRWSPTSKSRLRYRATYFFSLPGRLQDFDALQRQGEGGDSGKRILEGSQRFWNMVPLNPWKATSEDCWQQ